MKSEVELWLTCLQEAGTLHYVRIQRDAEYSTSRIEKEGLAFLTITLPRFEKDLLNAISLGRVGSNHFVGFRRRGGLPRFLSGFLCQIFDLKGSILPNADPTVIRSVRQILLLLAKVELPVTPERERKAVAQYIRTDDELVELNDRLRNKFRSTARELLSDYLSEVESRIWSESWVPRHSTGALATRESSNGRWSNTTWTERLQEFLPWWHDLTTIPSEIQFSDVTVLAREEEKPARLVLVPKTMKGPRVIVEEPVYNQYVQQGIFHVMSEVLRERRFQHLADAFSWDDQIPNRDLARFGSIDGSYATIDLNEASDRVSLELVEDLLHSVPYLRDIVFASRSEFVKLRDGKVRRLNKFASMGSSMCFPIESMVFFVIASIAQAETHAIAPSMLRKTLKYGAIRVYGDDIIVPEAVAQNALYQLRAYGLKVNVDKTFTTGLFRESCGSDWFCGKDVSVFKLRHILPTKRRHSELLRSAIEFHNRAYSAGWFLVAEYVAKRCDTVRERIPRAPVGSPGHSIWSWDGPFVVRTHPDYHHPQHRVLVFRERKPLDELDGYGALKKCLSYSGDQPRGKDHLQRGGRSQCVGVNIGWMAS